MPKFVTVKDFNLIDPTIVKSLSFNTSSNNSNQITILNNLKYYSELNALDVHNQNLNFFNGNKNLNLKTINCSYNSIDAINVSSNDKLEHLNCSFNQLDSVNVSYNPNLKYLNISYNFLDYINLLSNSSLIEFNCSNNKISQSLNLSGNSSLEKLNCSFNQLNELNLSQTPNLKELDCSYNGVSGFQYIDFSAIDTLEKVNCEGNNISTINFLNNNPNLKELICGDNIALLDFKLGSKSNLTYINCTGCPNVGPLDTSQLPALVNLTIYSSPFSPIDITYNPYIRRFSVANCNITEIDLSNQPDLEFFNCQGNGLETLDISYSDKIYYLNVSNNILNNVVLNASNVTTSSIVTYDFSNNNLPTSAINYILETLDGYTLLSATKNLYLGGPDNAGPNEVGITHIVSLQSKGWTVVSNIALPIITSFDPVSGLIGDTITITGEYFLNTLSVSFNGTSAVPTSITNTEIQVVVPPGASTGYLTVTTPAGVDTSPTEFIVNIDFPVITDFTPSSGPLSSTVIITGYYFVDVINVDFNGELADHTVDSSTQITATVPLAATTGPITVTTVTGIFTTLTDYTIVAVPTNISFTPSSGYPGDTITINGTDINNATNVSFGGVTATVLTNTNTQITATIPAGAVSGTISVTTAGGTVTSVSSFTVLVPAPTITSFTPALGTVGTSVRINGTNLSNATDVSFNGTSATILSNTNIKIVTTAPAGVTTGTITVTTAGGTATSAGTFTVGTPTVKLEYLPITSNITWYTGENYTGTSTTNDLTDFQNTVTPTDVYTIEFEDEANITSISNLSTYSNLKTLDVTFQSLPTLTLTGNNSIEQLYCDNNALTSLDLSYNNILTILSCNNNNLSSLNVDGMSNLINLSCVECTLPSLSLTTNTSLLYLTANNNNLSSINLNNNTQLLTVDLSENLLTSINLSANTTLQSLNVGVNSLSSLTLTANTALTYLNCESNTISSLNVSNLTNLNILYATNNTLSTINISNNTKLTEFYASVNNLTSITMPNSVTITTTYHFDASYNSLTQSAVDNILQKINSYSTPSGTNMTDKFIDLSGGSNAAPSVTGINAKNSLIAKGYQVLTN